MRNISARTVITIVLTLSVGIALVYWEYSRITCNSEANSYAKDNYAGFNSLSEANTGYNLSYKLCMREKGF
jgi:hypothetical protein